MHNTTGMRESWLVTKGGALGSYLGRRTISRFLLQACLYMRERRDAGWGFRLTRILSRLAAALLIISWGINSQGGRRMHIVPLPWFEKAMIYTRSLMLIIHPSMLLNSDKRLYKTLTPPPIFCGINFSI